MGSRRIKRLAGPAFYINLKYDQQLMKSQKENDAKGSSTLDLNNANGKAYENFDIKEGEIVVSKITSRKSKHAVVISSLNGADDVARDTKKTADEHKISLINNYHFIGVAQTEHVAKKKFEVDQGLVACVGGVVTVQNDHDATVHPGERLVLDIPSKQTHIRGIPSTKKRFCFKPMNWSDLSEDLRKAMVEETDAQGTPTATATALVGVVKFNDQQDFKEYYSRVLKPVIDRHTNFVAKAMSHAKAGERLDILLHPRHTSST